jgi:hypothetical protein
MNRVSYVGDSAAQLLHNARRRLARDGKALVHSRIRAKTAIEDALRRTLTDGDAGFLSFEETHRDRVVRNRLLETEAGEKILPQSVRTLADFPLAGAQSDRHSREIAGARRRKRVSALARRSSLPERRRTIACSFIVEGEVSVTLR